MVLSLSRVGTRLLLLLLPPSTPSSLPSDARWLLLVVLRLPLRALPLAALLEEDDDGLLGPLAAAALLVSPKFLLKLRAKPALLLLEVLAVPESLLSDARLAAEAEGIAPAPLPLLGLWVLLVMVGAKPAMEADAPWW